MQVQKMIKRQISYPRFISDIFPLQAIETASSETIMALWNSYHSPELWTVTKILSSVQYQILDSRLQISPSFLFPATVKGSKITLVSENLDENSWGFSNIEDEKPLHLLKTRFFDELAESKNIVPIRGEIIEGSLQKTDADKVLKAFVEFYLDDDLYFPYVEVFNKNFNEFNYENFLLEYIKIHNF